MFKKKKNEILKSSGWELSKIVHKKGSEVQFLGEILMGSRRYVNSQSQSVPGVQLSASPYGKTDG